MKIEGDMLAGSELMDEKIKITRRNKGHLCVYSDTVSSSAYREKKKHQQSQTQQSTPADIRTGAQTPVPLSYDKACFQLQRMIVITFPK